MAAEMRLEMDAQRVVVWATSPELATDLATHGPRSWTTAQVVEMARGKAWGHGLDTDTAAAAVRRMVHNDEGLVIEFDAPAFELVVVRHVASGAHPMPVPDRPDVCAKVTLAVVWAAARRGVARLFDELPSTWWLDEANTAGFFPERARELFVVLSTNHLNAKVPVFAHRKRGPDLYDITGEYLDRSARISRSLAGEAERRFKERVDAERVGLVRSFLAGDRITWVDALWGGTADEAAVDEALTDEFAKHGVPERWPKRIEFATIGELLSCLSWPDNATNRARVVAALVNLHTIHRPHNYFYKGRKRGTDKLHTRVFRSLEPLWRVMYEANGGGAIIVEPGHREALTHQIDPSTHGVPHHYTTLPLGRFAKLEAVAASTSVAREAHDLLVAFIRDAQKAKPEPDDINEFVLTYTLSRWAAQWAKPTGTPKRAKGVVAPANDDEVKAREAIHAYIDEATAEGRKVSNRDLATHLGVPEVDAKRLTERAGVQLRHQHRLVRPVTLPPNKLKAKVERALSVLHEQWPQLIVPGKGGRLLDAKPREDVFRVRVRWPGWSEHPAHRKAEK